ncbi:hypothetical protein K9M79_02870 [Candidatus Woesearchaeota archaeon]|nr:hypothetical protein [Candidatus Woesearchaeota archaeon]
MAKKPIYSSITGVWKSIKNVSITWGPGIIAMLVNHQAEWVPVEYEVPMGAFLGLISYFVKNKVEFKKK